MIKILLYLSVLFAPGIAAGEGVAPLDESQLVQQFDLCEQGDSKKIDCDDQEGPVSLGSIEIVDNLQLLTHSELVLRSSSSSPSHYSIRAPPISG